METSYRCNMFIKEKNTDETSNNTGCNMFIKEENTDETSNNTGCNVFIKEENTDETSNNTGTICQAVENIETIDAEFKTEKDVIGIFEFEGTVSETRSDLISLMNSDMRSKEKPLNCNVCDKEFRFVYTFNEHMAVHTYKEAKEKMKTISTETRVEKYNMSSSNKDKVKTVNTEIKVVKHIIGICEFEGTVLNNSHSSKLITHISSDNRPNLQDTHQKCNICNLSFNSKRLLTSHMKIRTIKNKETFICDICNISYYRKSYLMKHLLLHIGENPFICNKTFSDKPNFDIHKRIDTRKKTYKCDICEKTFTTSNGLISHTRVHTGEKPFKCNFCEKAFAKRSNLKMHTRIHTGEKPFKCDICDRRFSEAGSVSHKRTHTGEKPFECDICSKTFSAKYGLKSHIIHNHTKEYQFKCDICDKEFYFATLLKRHKMLHTEEKLYKCNICYKTFPFASYLKSHSKTHTNKSL